MAHTLAHTPQPPKTRNQDKKTQERPTNHDQAFMFWRPFRCTLAHTRRIPKGAKNMLRDRTGHTRAPQRGGERRPGSEENAWRIPPGAYPLYSNSSYSLAGRVAIYFFCASPACLLRCFFGAFLHFVLYIWSDVGVFSRFGEGES